MSWQRPSPRTSPRSWPRAPAPGVVAPPHGPRSRRPTQRSTRGCSMRRRPMRDSTGFAADSLPLCAGHAHSTAHDEDSESVEGVRPPGYPSEYEVELVLSDGREVSVRPILPSDAAELAVAFRVGRLRDVVDALSGPSPRADTRAAGVADRRRLPDQVRPGRPGLARAWHRYRPLGGRTRRRLRRGRGRRRPDVAPAVAWPPDFCSCWPEPPRSGGFGRSPRRSQPRIRLSRNWSKPPGPRWGPPAAWCGCAWSSPELARRGSLPRLEPGEWTGFAESVGQASDARGVEAGVLKGDRGTAGASAEPDAAVAKNTSDAKDAGRQRES